MPAAKMSYCRTCDRDFETWGALQQHNRSKHPLLYCSRCQRSFPSRSAKQQHITDSTEHHVCDMCPDRPDFKSENELNNHAETKHNYCTECESAFDSPGQLVQHDMDEHNMCHVCQRYFNSTADLKNHRKTHTQKTVNCPGCSQMFVSDSAMVLHLEAGTCESGADSDLVDEIAFDCYQSRRYTCDYDPDFDFKCPHCDAPFLYMSGVLQHAESDSCNQRLTKGTPLGKFLHYLWLRI